MFEQVPAKQCVTLREPTEGLWTDTLLSNAYFSAENIQILQNGIRAGVYAKSNGQYLIPPQDCEELQIIMRSIFLQHSRNLNTHITQQISELNKKVLDYAVDHVYEEARGRMKYLHDASTLVVPMSHPVLVAEYDKNTYSMPEWFNVMPERQVRYSNV